ncbi:MAG: hypothetical protein ABSD42_06860 [Candidatus Bathyarchaeia archaeon]
MQTMTKKKTSLNIDDKLWRDWILYVVKKTGTTQKVSEETERLIRKEMKGNPID